MESQKITNRFYYGQDSRLNWREDVLGIHEMKGRTGFWKGLSIRRYLFTIKINGRAQPTVGLNRHGVEMNENREYD